MSVYLLPILGDGEYPEFQFTSTALIDQCYILLAHPEMDIGLSLLMDLPRIAKSCRNLCGIFYLHIDGSVIVRILLYFKLIILFLKKRS